MDDSSRWLDDSTRAEDRQEQQRRYVVQFTVAAGETVSLKVKRDALMSAAGTRLWVTRAGDEWDYWLKPGETLRLSRGERVWVTGEAHEPAASGIVATTDAEVLITMYLERRRRIRWRWARHSALAL